MRKLLVRTLLLLALLLLVAAVAAVLLVPPLVESDEFGARVREGARTRLGAEVVYDALSIRWIPFEIALDRLSISNIDADAPPLLVAEHAALRIALLPLFVGRVVIHSLIADGAEAWLVRNEQGLVLPQPPAQPEPTPDEEEGDPARFLPGVIELTNSRLVYEDRTSSPPTRWALRGVEGRAHGSLVTLSLQAKLRGELETGGEIEIDGKVGLTGKYSAEGRVANLDPWSIELVRSQLEARGISAMEGLLAGTLQLEADADGLTSLDGELRMPEASVTRGELEVLGDLEARAKLGFRDEPQGELFLTLQLERGGIVKGQADWERGGVSNVEVGLEDVALAPWMALAPDLEQLGGFVGGQLNRPGRLDAPGHLQGKLDVRDAVVRTPDFALEGGVQLDVLFDPSVLAVAPAKEMNAGRIDVDLTNAELRYDPSYRKPAGTRATLSGQILAEPGGRLRLDVKALQVRDFDATGQVDFLRRDGLRVSALRLRSNRFDLEGWGELVPVLGEEVDGELRIDRLEISFDPPLIEGRVLFDELSLQDRGAFTGVVDLLGNRMVGKGMSLRVGGQLLTADLQLEDIHGSPTFDVRIATPAPIDTNAFVEGLLRRRSSLSGPGELTGVLTGPVSSEALDEMSGKLEIRVGGEHGKGRIEELSWFALVVGAVREADEAQRDRRPPSIFSGMTGDQFDLLETTAVFSKGRVRSDDFRIVYPGYTVSLGGSIGLADGDLDLKGHLTLVGRLVKMLIRGASDVVEIPIAQVTGTFADPQVRVGPEAKDLLTSFFVAQDIGTKAVELFEGLLKGGD